jgi:hypothetical protein
MRWKLCGELVTLRWQGSAREEMVGRGAECQLIRVVPLKAVESVFIPIAWASSGEGTITCAPLPGWHPSLPSVQEMSPDRA